MRELAEYDLIVGEKTWRLDLATSEVGDWCEMEERSGMDCAELVARFLSGGIRARRAFLWLAHRANGNPVDWDSRELTGIKLGEMQLRHLPRRKRKRDEPTSEDAGQAPDPPEPVAEDSSATK